MENVGGVEQPKRIVAIAYFLAAVAAGFFLEKITSVVFAYARVNDFEVFGGWSLSTLVGILTIPIYLWTSNALLLWSGALLMGFFGAGNFGVVPAYLNERFPTVVRAAGAGFAYHVGAGLGSFTPTLVGRLQDLGFSLPLAMSACIAASGTLVMILIWMGPETRGREFHALEGMH